MRMIVPIFAPPLRGTKITPIPTPDLIPTAATAAFGRSGASRSADARNGWNHGPIKGQMLDLPVRIIKVERVK